jgi:predicted transcriptional regulator
MTQANLAGRIGQYQSYVARLESGQRRIDVVD